MELIKTFRQFTYGIPLHLKMRSAVKQIAINLVAFNQKISVSNSWIRFPYYHHVFDDEKKGFERQLKYLKNFGEFISMDDVVQLIEQKEPLNGRYFCVSFDDGYRCLYNNMLEVTAPIDIPVIIYLPTDYIGLHESREEDVIKIKNNRIGNPRLLSFLNWDQCREMLQHKVSFGSHTKSHAALKNLQPHEIEQELQLSKKMIQEELQVPCVHFACPWGLKDIHFDPTITTPLAKAMGYRTFATTHRGKMLPGDDLFLLKRDHLLANWSNAHLAYFFNQ